MINTIRKKHSQQKKLGKLKKPALFLFDGVLREDFKTDLSAIIALGEICRYKEVGEFKQFYLDKIDLRRVPTNQQTLIK